MAANEVVIVVRAQDQASTQIKGIQANATAMFSGIAAGATAVGAALAATAVTGRLVAFGKSAVAAASDASESLNKMRVVFGDTSASVEAFAKNSARDFGLSNQKTMEYLGTFGNLLTAMELSKPLAADMSEGIVKLASDLASFNNIGVDEALEKIRAGLVGEQEPLRALGVNLNQATIEAEAMRMGLIKTGETMSAATKAQASYSLILQQTKAAQGDFARTSDGLANQQRILTARIEDLKAKLGAALLPVVTDIVTKFSAWMDINGEDWATKFAGAVDKIAGAASTAAEKVGILLDALNKVDSFGRENTTQTMGKQGWGQFTTGRGFLTETARRALGLPLLEAGKDFLDNNPILNATRSGSWEQAQLDRMANGGQNPLTGGVVMGQIADDLGDFMAKAVTSATSGGPKKIAAAGGGGGSSSNPLAEAWKRVQATLQEEMVKTWMRGGEEQRRIAEDMNAATVEEVQRTAERIHQTLGVDMAESVTMAFEFIRDREKALAEARIKNAEEATAALIKLMEAEGELAKRRAQEAFSLTQKLWSSFGGGGSVGAANNLALLAQAAAAGDVTLGGSQAAADAILNGGVTNNITVSGIVGDPVSTGQAIADAINAAASSGGAVISSGAVE
jgi:hypothetical protein